MCSLYSFIVVCTEWFLCVCLSSCLMCFLSHCSDSLCVKRFLKLKDFKILLLVYKELSVLRTEHIWFTCTGNGRVI